MKLPNLIGVGVEKCGTTLINNVLSLHPEVLTPRKKELFFFNQNYDQGLDWYLNWYDDSRHWTYKADITPSYFRAVRTLERIQLRLPDAKIIIVLRHPVERAFSHYVHSIRHNALGDKAYTRSFWEEFESGGKKKLLFPLYGRMLSPILDLFPRSSILVLIYEVDILHLEAGATRLFDFLGLERPAGMGLPQGKINAGYLPCFRIAKRPRTALCGPQHEDTLEFCHAKGRTSLSPRDNKRGEELIAGARNWTGSISAEESRQLYYTHFANDSEEFADKFKVDISRWQEFRDIEYPVAGTEGVAD